MFIQFQTMSRQVRTGPGVVVVLAAAMVATVMGVGIGSVVVIAVAAVGSGPCRYEDTPLEQGSPKPDWSYSRRSSRGRGPRVDAICHRAGHTPAQGSP